jgi:hypothetical protein
MRILLSGRSGFVGRAVADRLTKRGDTVVPLVRGQTADGVGWDPKRGVFDAAAAEGAEAVVHLAGENVASGRWTAERKREIYESRVAGTRLLAAGLARLSRRPRVLVCASAIGFYGSSGDAEQTEASPLGRGFLAEVCRDWEGACAAASAAGIRVVNVRIGLVLSPKGGALAQMLPLFRFCLGGRIGDGRQWMSWVTLDDLVRVIELGLDDEALRGPVNGVAPQPIRNADFTRILASVLGRPALIPVPAAALRLVLGEMADEMLLSSTRVVPKRLDELRFRFEHPRLEEALQVMLSDRRA